MYFFDLKIKIIILRHKTRFKIKSLFYSFKISKHTGFTPKQPKITL